VSTLEVIVIVVAIIGFLGIVGWRAGGSRATGEAQAVERNRELDE
jgi:predicted negative regulator of RcsB-dependent stress response